MNHHRPDDVGQSLGLPDFVDPDDVVEASLDASARWGDDASASARASHARSARADAAAGRTPGRAFAADGRPRKQKTRPQLSWAQKAERKQQRAEKRRAQEATERERDPMGFAREVVLTQLAAAPRSRAYLAGKLRDKEVEDDVIEAVLDRMEDVGLVDDAAYAGMLVRSQVASRGLARRALQRELQRKGIDERTSAAALDEVDDEAERTVALELARKKLRTMSRLDTPTQTRRLAGLLARKGYPPAVVWSVVRDVLGDDAAGDGL